MPTLASLGDFATSHIVVAGLPPEATQGLLASIAATQFAFADVAAARHEYTLATAVDVEARAAIRAGGLTPERSDALTAGETRLAAATAALEATESGLRDIAYDALVARVGAENALLARRVAGRERPAVPDCMKRA